MMLFNQLQSVDVKKAKAMISGGNVTVIDVRSPKAYKEQHVDGAILGDKTNWDQFVGQLDKSKEVICYCYKGMMSRSFCHKLKKAGFANVYNLKGGFDGWKKADT